MEGVLVSAATGVMNSVLAKLAAFLGDEYKHAKGVRDDLVFLQSELSAMNIVLQKLADVDELDELSRDWRDRVRDLAYDIEDCIDLSIHRLRGGAGAGESGLAAKAARMAKKIVSFRQIASQIQKLKARVVEVNERRNRYTLPGLVSTSSDAASSSKVDVRLCALWKETEQLVGIDGPRDDIISRLEQKESSAATAQHDVRMVSIVGCAGLGKTTLAKQVYDKIKEKFGCKAFVSVSQKPNIKELLTNISTQVGKSTNTSDDVANLVDNLRDYLKQKRYIVVVDDIWKPEPWNFIGEALVKTSPGSIIILTTRVKEVAMSSSSSHGGFVYPMKHLDDAHSKRLFYKRIFDCEEQCPPEFEQASKEILERCDGIPLAIISISSFLADRQSLYHWNEVKKIISSPLPGNKHLETMQSVLALSYYNLPHDLRSCLLYLSSFPEDCVIAKDHLVSRWIAEGFINARPGESLYEAGLRYFNLLINRSLIQPWGEYGEVMSCRVHDVILNFIVSKSVEENFMTLLDPSGLVPLQHSNCCKVRRMSLQGSCSLEKFASSMKSIKPHVRSLACSMDGTGLHPLSEFKVARVLHLEGCQSLTNNHLANIEKLVHLRYLSIRGTGVSVLPANIGRLQHLETLDITRTRVKELPPSIVLLQRLARLFVSEDVKFPAEGVSKIQALELLTCLSVFNQPESFLMELGELTKLRALDVLWDLHHIGYSDEVQGDEREKSYEKIFTSSLNALDRHNLHSLYLLVGKDTDRFLFDSWFPALKNLRKLCIINGGERTTIPGWIRLAAKLEQLELTRVFVTQEDLQMFGDLKALESLDLFSSDTRGSWLTVSNHGFRRLKSARISNVLFMPDSMPNLKDLHIDIRLDEVGENDSVFQHLPSTLCRVDALICGNPPLRDAVSKLEEKILNVANTHPNRPTLTTETYIEEDKRWSNEKQKPQ
uniref:AAA+ ATPase domain-containing protein n=1 Tax=Oryza punctata TaxID=4537 RepID=A0A0E0L898_ORYPU